MTDETVNRAYELGFLHGLRAFAWWKDGVEVVGVSPPRPLKEVAENIESVWNWQPPVKRNQPQEAAP